MSWKDNLLEASYKGVSFKIESSTQGIGRRTKLHQFINREKPYLEDLGREAETISVEGYIVQSPDNDYDYFPNLQQLQQVFREKNPGLLIHPYFGIKKVGVVGQASFSVSSQAGGIVRFSVIFTEYGKRAIPETKENLLTKINNKINDLSDKVNDAVYKIYDTVQTYSSTASSAIGKVTSTINGIINLSTNFPTASKRQVLNNISIIKSTMQNALDAPEKILTGLKDSCNSLSIMAGLGQDISTEQSRTLGFATIGEKTTGERTVGDYIYQTTISDTTIGGEEGSVSGISRGEIVELDGEIVPEVLGKNLIKAIHTKLTNFDVSEYKSTPDEQQANVVLIIYTMKFYIICNAARIAILTDFFSQEEIEEYKDMIVDIINDIIADLGEVAADGGASIDIGTGTDMIDTSELYNACEEIKNNFAKAMTEKIYEYARIVDYTPPTAGINCLSLAYDKYEDLNRYWEIYRRNKNTIRHPGFISGNQKIRILSE